MPSTRHHPVAACDREVLLVGRCSPLPGVFVRNEPDRQLQRRFLTELRQHLLGDEMLLSLLPEASSDAQRVAIAVVRDQHRHLRDLLADFELYGRLELDLVPVSSGSVMLMPWLEQALAMLAARCEQLGAQIKVTLRSFVPDRVVFDVALAARALQGVLDVAAQRAAVGPIELRVAYQANADARTGELAFSVATCGGGFSEVELGYVFQPFLVQDCASRSLLGLSIAHRLAKLLGGELSVESPGCSVCVYRLTVAAEPERGALWLDPGPGHKPVGPLRPDRVLFVGLAEEASESSRMALQQDGFLVERVGRVEQVLARLGRQPDRWSALVIEAAAESKTIDGFLVAVRQHGFAGAVVVIGAALGHTAGSSVLECHLPALDAAAVLTAVRRCRDR